MIGLQIKLVYLRTTVVSSRLCALYTRLRESCGVQ